MSEEEKEKQEEKKEEQPKVTTQFIQPEDAFIDVKWTWNPPTDK